MNRFGHRWCAVTMISATMLCAGAAAQDQGAEARKAANEKVAAEFAKADKNGDGKLALDEFLPNHGAAQEAKRDFLLFDQDSDGFLSRDEFATVPTVIEPWFRGVLPDPMTAVVDSVAAALDKSLNDWDKQPRRMIAAAGFIQAFSERFSKKVVLREIDMREADQNGNGKVTRDEARQFLEIQLGVRRADGSLLREPSGRVVNYMLYNHIDKNRNDRLEKAEYLERSFAGAGAADEFKSANKDEDDALSFDEFQLLPWRGMTDPIAEFRKLDTNFDAYVDPAELAAGTEDWKRTLSKSAFPGFDLNGDGKLSLAEYRLTMQANMVLPWQDPVADTDDDGKLSISEFRFETLRFPLLRMIYFRRLDTNGNGQLEPSEFTFQVKTPDEFFTLDEDGTNWKSIFKFEGHPACGSPAVSPDGKQVAFDAWPQGKMSGSALYVMDVNGGKPRQVALGMMPSWSKTGTQLACSCNSPIHGVWVMNVNDDGQKHIGSGWGAQVSPDGTRIACISGNAAIKIYDLEQDTDKVVFDGSNDYAQVFWNMGWSPDGTRLCLKGLKADGKQEVAIVQVSGEDPKLKARYSTMRFINADFAWHPNGHRIVFAAQSVERNMTQLFEFDPDRDDAPTLVKGQDPKRNNTDACWTPDGKRLIIVSGDY